MPGSRSRIVCKDAYVNLSNAAFDFDVRPHELADAIVVLTDWERHIDKLVGYIKKGRGERLGSESGPVSGPDPGLLSGHTESRVLPGRSRVSRVPRKRGIAASPFHRIFEGLPQPGRAEPAVKQPRLSICFRT